MQEEIINLLLKFIKKGDFILEAGCGDGSLLRKIKKKVDVNAFCVDPAGRNVGTEIVYRSLPAESIDKLDENFNLIFTVYSFHHFNNPEEFLNKTNGKLHQDGKLIIVDWKYSADTGVKERYLKAKEIKQLLAKAGFHVVKKILRGNTQIFVSSKISRFSE